MTSVQAGPNYDARIRRAKHLGAQYSFSSEVMTFYGQLAVFQKRLYGALPEIGPSSATANLSAGFRSPLDLAVLLPHFPDFLAVLQSAGPAPIVDAARQLALQGPAAWIAFLTDYWSASGSARHSVAPPHTPAESQHPASEVLTEFILRVFVQPYAEFLAARCAVPTLETAPRLCPICGSGPLLGVLCPEGDGGRRSLACSFCLHEWSFRRILCAFCGEEAENKLPVYIAEKLPHIRVEACDTCKSCLRTIDLTKDGHAIPVVDDLAAIPLTLWACEQGYSRPHPNILAT
jgi:formate dehydrogenase accessory protein FdhE